MSAAEGEEKNLLLKMKSWGMLYGHPRGCGNFIVREDAMTKGLAAAVMGVIALALGLVSILPSVIILLMVALGLTPTVLNVGVFAGAVLIALLALVLSPQQILLLVF